MSTAAFLAPQAACDKTFAQVAGETAGLSILKTVLSQASASHRHCLLLPLGWPCLR